MDLSSPRRLAPTRLHKHPTPRLYQHQYDQIMSTVYFPVEILILLATEMSVKTLYTKDFRQIDISKFIFTPSNLIV